MEQLYAALSRKIDLLPMGWFVGLAIPGSIIGLYILMKKFGLNFKAASPPASEAPLERLRDHEYRLRKIEENSGTYIPRFLDVERTVDRRERVIDRTVDRLDDHEHRLNMAELSIRFPTRIAHHAERTTPPGEDEK